MEKTGRQAPTPMDPLARLLHASGTLNQHLDRFRHCRAVLLDFGGTLDSDGEHWLDRFYDLYPKTGLGVAQADIKRVFYQADQRCCRSAAVNAMGLRALMDHHVRLQLDALGLDSPQAAAFLVERFCDEIEYHLVRNALLLARLKRHFKLGVVSNFYGNVEVLCREFGLAPHLDVILDSIHVGLSKPDPAFFQEAARRLGIPGRQILFVGDSYDRDMVPARQAGMKTIWLKGPAPRLPDHPVAVDAWIHSLCELERLMP